MDNNVKIRFIKHTSPKEIKESIHLDYLYFYQVQGEDGKYGLPIEPISNTELKPVNSFYAVEHCAPKYKINTSSPANPSDFLKYLTLHEDEKTVIKDYFQSLIKFSKDLDEKFRQADAKKEEQAKIEKTKEAVTLELIKKMLP